MTQHTPSNGQKIAQGIENNLRSNLELVTEQIDDIQHRLDALLVTADGVLDEETAIQIAQVRKTMLKIPAYREKCGKIQRKMETCDRRIAHLSKFSRTLRSQVSTTTAGTIASSLNPFTEEFPLNAALAVEKGLGSRGLLFYRVVYGGGVSVRSQPSFESPRIGKVLPYNHVFQAIVRYSPNGIDMFVCLADNTGWVFEAKGDTPILERVPDPTLFVDDEEVDEEVEDKLKD